jgi:mono/diheme cytochrome c family protein
MLLLLGWIFAMLIVLHGGIVVRATRPSLVGDFFPTESWPAVRGLPSETELESLPQGYWRISCWLVTAAVIAVGIVNLYWGLAALRRWKRVAGFRHLSILLCCALLAFGVQWLYIARDLTDQPIVLDYSKGKAVHRRAPSANASLVSVVGDAQSGKKLFSISCVTCHGPTGDGLNNLAPSLRQSDFVKAGDVSAIIGVITNGRALTDPGNKSGKVMPAKGGNPFLKPEQIADLAAFVASLPGSPADGAGSQANGSEGKPTVVLNKWVVPAATDPPSGIAWFAAGGDGIVSPFPDVPARKSLSRNAERMQAMMWGAVFLHSMLLVGLFLVSGQNLFSWLLEKPRRSSRGWMRVATCGWFAAAIGWLLILVVYAF